VTATFRSPDGSVPAGSVTARPTVWWMTAAGDFVAPVAVEGYLVDGHLDLELYPNFVIGFDSWVDSWDDDWGGEGEWLRAPYLVEEHIEDVPVTRYLVDVPLGGVDLATVDR
jgi:hypothetical protein